MLKLHLQRTFIKRYVKRLKYISF